MPSNDSARKRYSDAISANVSLIDLRLRDISAELLLPGPRLPIKIEPRVSPRMVRVPSAVLYHCTYHLVGSDSRGREIMKADVTYSIAFKFNDDTEYSDEELEAFGELAVLDILHPYIRESVHSLTGRMGLPSLVLDIKPPATTSDNTP